LLQDVLENGKVGLVGVLARQEGNDQDRLLPLGVETELVFQVLAILFAKDMKGGDPAMGLTEVSDGSSLLPRPQVVY